MQQAVACLCRVIILSEYCWI